MKIEIQSINNPAFNLIPTELPSIPFWNIPRLVYRYMFEKRYYFLTREKLNLQIFINQKRKLIVVPKQFQHDFATVPKIFWFILPPINEAALAYVLHDWLYFEKPYSRKVCDKLMLKTAAFLGEKWLTRTIKYLSVRAFGGGFYKRNKRTDLKRSK